MSVRKISARYAGKCGDCGEPIAVGDLILYGGRGRVAHANGECKIENVPAGPTTRERREAKAERLRGWSAGRAAKAESGLERAREMGSIIPFGQPILVGHYSEGRDRRYRARINGTYERAFADHDKALSMASRADGIESQLDNSIYSDDDDAIERLQERIVERTATRDAMKARNAAYRKEHRAELKLLSRYDQHQAMPFASFEITNLTADIRRNQQRLEQLTTEARREAERAVNGPQAEREPAEMTADKVNADDVIRVAGADRLVVAVAGDDGKVRIATACGRVFVAAPEASVQHVGFGYEEPWRSREALRTALATWKVFEFIATKGVAA